MDLITFHDRIYGKYQGQLYTFESTWDSFRPITGIAWNGTQFVPNDAVYKQSLFDDWYGYGSSEQKALCRILTHETELETAKEVKDPIHVWRWYGEKNIQWWKDRPCVFLSPCTSRDASAWKQYLQYLEVRAKTLRRPFKQRMTRRLIGR